MSLRVACLPTSGAYSRDLFAPGNAPVTERDWERACYPLLGGARLCSLLLGSDLGGRDEPQAEGSAKVVF